MGSVLRRLKLMATVCFALDLQHQLNTSTFLVNGSYDETTCILPSLLPLWPFQDQLILILMSFLSSTT